MLAGTSAGVGAATAGPSHSGIAFLMVGVAVGGSHLPVVVRCLVRVWVLRRGGTGTVKPNTVVKGERKRRSMLAAPILPPQLDGQHHADRLRHLVRVFRQLQAVRRFHRHDREAR